jgi:simple sugar transport system ATP-binding protein
VEALVGLRPRESGRIRLENDDITSKLDRVAYIPEDRIGLGSVADMSLLENFALTARDDFTRGPLLSWKTVEAQTRQSISRFNIAASSMSMKARQLSGGNLQKMILAREFSRKPFLLIAEQPTRGLDIGATEEIWQTLLHQREQGAIILVSGDLKEVLSLADNILVMFRGQVMNIISCDDEEGLDEIGPLMAGVKKIQ